MCGWVIIYAFPSGSHQWYMDELKTLAVELPVTRRETALCRDKRVSGSSAVCHYLWMAQEIVKNDSCVFGLRCFYVNFANIISLCGDKCTKIR